MEFWPNNNVYGLYHRAIVQLGVRAVISVMNINYGDPQDDEGVTPFDSR